MLFVEGDAAAAVRVIGLRLSAAGRPASEMNNFDRRLEQDPASARADGGAEVDVLRVHEKTFIEQPDGLGIFAPDEEASAADPIGIMAPSRQLLDGIAPRPSGARFR